MGNNVETTLTISPQTEELDPELKKTVFRDACGLEFIDHPLIHDIYLKKENYWYNVQFKMKQHYLLSCQQRKAWRRYVMLHERPYRIEAFQTIEHYLKNKDYWDFLGDLWVDSENIYQNKQLWKTLLTSDRKNKEYFMNKIERDFLKNLPDEIVIYRGYTKGLNLKGFSYTLSKDMALFFSQRHNPEKGDIVEKVIKTKHVFAYKNSGKEEEIILLTNI